MNWIIRSQTWKGKTEDPLKK
uniref:Uncharacterized protein n=1 Tax=Arundo donax TaxID=35708 RepID=A0A0A9CE06_ARUDO